MSFRRGILLIICFTRSSSLTLSHTQTHTSLSAPCVPVNVHAAVKCSSNTVVASWDARPGALSYTGTLDSVSSDAFTITTGGLVNMEYPILRTLVLLKYMLFYL